MLTTLALALLPLAGPQDAADPERDLRSKDPALREAAVVALSQQGGERAEKLLLKALKDKDWLVLLRAAEGLARHGAKDSTKPLLQLATGGPFRAARDAAGVALATAAPGKALEELVGDLRGRSSAVAVRVLAELLAAGATPPAGDLEDLRKRVRRLLESEEPAERRDAARAWVASAPPALRGAALDELMQTGDLVQRAAGIEMATRLASALPGERDVDWARDLLARPGLPPVLERRAIAFAVAALGALPDESARATAFVGRLLTPLAKVDGGHVRAARVLERAARLLPAAECQGWLERLLARDDLALRAAAAKALRGVGGEAAGKLATTALATDDEWRVREQHVLTAAAHGALDGAAGEAAIAARVTEDPSARVREIAAIALGREGASEGAVAALVRGTRDAEWEVAVSAAVALGKTRSDVALRHLTELSKSGDWRVRGAAAVGLYHVARADAVAPLIALLDDATPAVAESAHRALLQHAGREGEEVDPDDWTEWWRDNLTKVRFQSPEEVRARREKYGYSVPDREIYRGLDVVVVPGRGDLMENVLDRLGITYRTVQAGQLGAAGLHPFAILVAGCTGELEVRDLEVVQWYVRAGGALFTSCWALTYTVERSFPGLVTKFPSPGEVLDRVSATPVEPASPYLTGVFDGGVVPIYELQGAHLIQVLDPERVQVLVDSPETAMRHGSGDLTAWFRAGHGVVLDSVNHFDLQGLMLATHLDGAEELQGYAVDHMGLSLEVLRETAKERWWRSRSKAAEEVDDLSAFRILTNFVREKRINGG